MATTSTRPPKSVRNKDGSRKRILLVDDDVDMAKILARALHRDYEVTIANDGVEGLEVASRMPFDLLVTDIEMPGLDGVSMVQRLRATRTPPLPVLFLTAKTSARDIAAAIAVGARGYIPKPIDLARFEERIGRVLREG